MMTMASTHIGQFETGCGFGVSPVPCPTGEVFHEYRATFPVVTVRIVVAVALFCVLAAVAWWLERRRRTDAPTQGAAVAPDQLDRSDFPRPDAVWLVVLFTSANCMSCEGLFEKASPLESADVAVVEAEFPSARDIHERYKIAAAPMTVIADRDGVVRGTLIGAYNATELWNAVAELRDAQP
jgi:hypothetical protein